MTRFDRLENLSRRDFKLCIAQIAHRFGLWPKEQRFQIPDYADVAGRFKYRFTIASAARYVRASTVGMESAYAVPVDLPPE